MKRTRAVFGAGLLVGAAVLALVPTAASAATLTQAGWWWRVHDGALPVPLPAPPTVPEGGLMVAGAPDGATAVAALHFDLGEGETAPVLTLSVAEGGDQGGGQALLGACVTGSAWQPASGGAWTSKPFPACALGSVNGVRSADGATWTFALAPLLSDGILDITLVPGLDPTLPDGANGSAFQLVFEAPTTASLATSSGAPGGSDLDVPSFDAPADFASPGFATPGSGAGLALAPVAGFTPSLPEADQGLTATAPVAQERNSPLPTSPVSTVEDHKALGAIILALSGAALLWSSQVAPPEPRRLGTFGARPDRPRAAAASPDHSDPAGVGRFARPRSGQVPRL